MQRLIGILLLLFFQITSLAADNSQTPLNMQQLISGEQPLKVGYVFPRPPYYITKDTGMDVDLLNAVAHQAKIQKVEFVQFSNFTDLLSGLRKGKIDVIAAGLFQTPEREKEFLFSKSYEKGGIGLLYDKNKQHYQSLQNLNQHNIGTLTGGYGIFWLPKNKISPRSLKTYDSWQEMLSALQRGDIDFVLSSYTVCRYEAAQDKNKWQVVLLQEIPIVYAVSKQNTALQEALNQSIDALQKNGTLHRITTKYLSPPSINPQ